MRKLLLATLAILAIAATPALAAPEPFIDLPSNMFLQFNGDGSLATNPTGTIDPETGIPNLPPIGTEAFGIANILSVAPVADQGHPVWQPTDVGPNFEMTLSFWGAFIDQSWVVFNVQDNTYDFHATYNPTQDHPGPAHVVFVSDVTKDFSNVPGPGPFDLATGDYPTAYTLPAGGAAVDPGEALYLSMDLSGMSSTITWDAGINMFTSGKFHAKGLQITGGYGAWNFVNPGDFGAGTADAFIMTFSPAGWTFGADTDVRLTTIPEPATWISLCTGLALLGTYGLRKRM